MKSPHKEFTFISNNTNPDDKSGIGIFHFEDAEYEIPFTDSKYFFDILKIIDKHKELAKISMLNTVIDKLNILSKELKYLDY